MSFWHDAETYDVLEGAIHRRLKGEVSIDSKPGTKTALTQEEEAALVDILLRARRHGLAVSRSELLDAVRTLCLDGRFVP